MFFFARDNPSFTGLAYKQDRSAEASRSPFQYLLYEMHCICLGVVRRLIGIQTEVHISADIGLCKSALKGINVRLIQLRPNIPCEFHRKYKAVYEHKTRKAKEFRQFLFYLEL